MNGNGDQSNPSLALRKLFSCAAWDFTYFITDSMARSKKMQKRNIVRIGTRSHLSPKTSF
jgi:hypothetical protein